MADTPRVTWQPGNGGDGINGYAGTITPRVFQIWREEHRWVLSSALPGQFTMVSVDEDPEPLKAEAEDWLERFIISIGASFVSS